MLLNKAMAELVTFRNEVEGEESPRLGVALSVALHIIIFAALFIGFNRVASSEIVAAGPGEGGEGGGGSIEVGVADKSAILGFAKPQPVSHLGDTDESTTHALKLLAAPIPIPRRCFRQPRRTSRTPKP